MVDSVGFGIPRMCPVAVVTGESTMVDSDHIVRLRVRQGTVNDYEG